ncbi:MAG: ABC transporter ATP-binding protein [Clostridiales bacterium]|jgi:putative ABC transport system ATP-binding protein|nr:ABC transporter ATP-binding protein [Clostridiales bacterium]
MSAIIEFKNIVKSYGVNENRTFALRGASFTVDKGEFVVILGPSGSGKSTILNLIGGMGRADCGEIVVGEKNIANYGDKELSEYRADNIGFVFQFYNLIPTLTVRENVALVKEVSKNYAGADRVLGEVGLSAHKNKFPSQLSGGEQQRAAIARALVKNPPLLLCDEPTGALDSGTGIVILSLLQNMSGEGRTVIVVTHNSALADAADKVIRVKDGRIESVSANEKPLTVEEVNW